MKRLLSILLGTLLTVINPLCIAAENQALKRECETKAENAAQLIRTLGAEAAFKKITDPQGPFVSKTSHVFCIDAGSGSLLAHKVSRFVGSNMHYYTDADGNHPYSGILQRAEQSEDGWTRYMTYGSGPEKRKTPALKNMYYLKVPGQAIVLCCGYWEDA
jgi:hypothetical protein